MTDNMDCSDRFALIPLGLDANLDGIANPFTEGRLMAGSDSETLISHLTGDITDAELLDDSKTNCKTLEKLVGTARHVNDRTPTIEHPNNLTALAQVSKRTEIRPEGYVSCIYDTFNRTLAPSGLVLAIFVKRDCTEFSPA